MKGIQGLIVAVVLGVIGALFNFVYLSKGRDIESEHFIGIKAGTKIPHGKPINADHLAKLEIPKEHVGNLKIYAYPWRDADTILGRKAIRNFTGGELIMREDLRTPPPRLELEGNETAIWAPIDTRTTITSQIIPRVTPVSLYLPVSRNPAAIKSTAEDWEWLGPFEVLSVGNRLGSLEVMKADNISAKQNNVLTLRATSKTGQPDANVVTLQDYLVKTSYAPLRVKLHAPLRKKDAP